MSITEKKEKSERVVDVEGLDDGLAVDYDLSENEEGTEINGEAAEDVAEEQGGEPEEEEKKVNEEKTLGKKRKVNEAQKSKKKQKMEFEKESKKGLSSEQTDIIVEKLSSKIRELFPQLSALELADYYLNKSNVVDTNDFTPERGLARVLNATPSRVDKILEISKMDHEKNPEVGFSLKEDEISAVVLDNYVDPKLRSVLECAETFELLKKLKTANPALKVYLY
ncbi:hypothetical protein PMKS-002930 [Pichia membranifaciens]|uniref:Uncharacterized protein n=1 Tax=Pichia membranifaciens TaxID=4926 RepID=A0A1Q2YIR9_9ASCO|nr:hypothetical protein PMKS-002930 [Pichia membranifaciens]